MPWYGCASHLDAQASSTEVFESHEECGGRKYPFEAGIEREPAGGARRRWARQGTRSGVDVHFAARSARHVRQNEVYALQGVVAVVRPSAEHSPDWLDVAVDH